MDFLRQLDTATLAFVTGLAGLLLAATMVGIRLAGMRSPALLFWGIAGLAAGIGHLLAHVTLTLGITTPPMLALSLANGLVTLVHAMLLAGVLAFLGRRTWWLPLSLLALSTGLIAQVWPEGWQHLRNRILVLASLYLVLDVTAGILLWRAGSQRGERFQNLVASAFLLNGATIVMRLVHTVYASTPDVPFAPGPFQTLVFVLSLAFISSLTLGLALLMFRSKEIELQRLVHRDPMTGLFNRRSLFEHGAREQARAERYGTPLAFVLLDIDDFKTVNDTFGHATGDDVICQTAARVACALRDVDAAFRLGGEEFLILLPCTGLDAAVAVAERLRAEIAQVPMEAIARSITASFGVTELARGHEDWESAMRRADVALYRAKDEGRNRVFAMSGMRAPATAIDARAVQAVDVP
ncbi:MAG: GGDEF domain-containing protein [Lysobacter sp.]|nr:MAG: GGDEF domain-containing protein [Lysobacter sp.]